VAIATEANPGTAGIGVASEAEIAAVVVPRSMTVEIRRMNSLVCAAHTISVSVAPGAGAGRIIDVVTGSAILGIRAHGTSVFGSPRCSRVGQRHPVFASVTVIAECLSVVAAGAIGIFALSVETVSKLVVQIVNTSGLIVASVTAYAEALLLMAGVAPIRLERSLFGMLVLPANRMDLGQRSSISVTDATIPGGAVAIVTIHAQWLARHSRCK